MYTIGQVSEMFHIPVSTLRYYDKEGLFPGLERASGIRRFGDCLLYTSPSPRDLSTSRMPSSA